MAIIKILLAGLLIVPLTVSTAVAGEDIGTVKAAETVDKCIEKVATAGYEHGYTVFILADHGNSDVMRNPDGSPNTQHSTNLVPLIVMDKERNWNLKPGKLGDVAPSILKVMDVPIPEIMTGDVLVS